MKTNLYPYAEPVRSAFARRLLAEAARYAPCRRRRRPLAEPTGPQGRGLSEIRSILRSRTAICPPAGQCRVHTSAH